MEAETATTTSALAPSLSSSTAATAAAAATLTSLQTNENDESSSTATNTTSTIANVKEKPNNVGPRLGNCEVCATKLARYCCPKCEVKTCCLDCSKIHKRELKCDGIRDRTKFVPLNRMTKQDFMSDYYFLEECTRFIQDRRFDRLKNFKCRFQKHMPLRVQRLLRAAYKRKIRLVKSLPHFTRYKENTSVYKRNVNKIFWRIEWIFINAIKTTKIPNDININNDDVASASFVRYVDEQCDEGQTLGVLLTKYMDNKLQYKELNYYQSAGLGGLKLFLRAERRLPNGSNHRNRKYYELDINKSLNANLQHKTVIEYPSIYVSYEQQPAGFETIVDSDDELDYKNECLSNIEKLFRKQPLLELKPKGKASKNDDHEQDKNATSTAALRQLLQLKNLSKNLLFCNSDDEDGDDDDGEDENHDDDKGNAEATTAAAAAATTTANAASTDSKEEISFFPFFKKADGNDKNTISKIEIDDDDAEFVVAADNN